MADQGEQEEHYEFNDNASDETIDAETRDVEDVREALANSGIGNSQADLSCYDMPCGPDDDIGRIDVVNASDGAVTHFEINLNETVGNALGRATSGNGSRFDFALKDGNGTVLAPNMTLRDAGVELGGKISLIARDSGIGSMVMSPPPELSSDIANLDDFKEIIVNGENGEVFKTAVRATETVDDVITSVTQTRDNEEFALIANGRPLARNTPVGNVVANTSSLQLRENGIQVFVRTPETRNPITLDLRRSDTVMRLKERLRDQNQVPLHQQRLQFQSKPLNDEDASTRTLKSYGIKNHSTIESTYRLRGGCN